LVLILRYVSPQFRKQNEGLIRWPYSVFYKTNFSKNMHMLPHKLSVPCIKWRKLRSQFEILWGHHVDITDIWCDSVRTTLRKLH